jgi:hypothetical protein
MHLAFLTPLAALVTLLVAVPVYAFAKAWRRDGEVRRALGLPAPPLARRLAPVVAVALTLVFIGAAAAQPVVEHRATRHERTDAAAYVVFDISLSMAASTGLDGPGRLDRARRFALALRPRLPSIPVGVATVTDRVLPMLFPTTDEGAFAGVVRRSLVIDSPPPERFYSDRATSLDSLSAFARSSFFDPAVRHRVLVVLTDGESLPIGPHLLDAARQPRGLSVVFVHVSQPADRVYSTGVRDPNYHPDPASDQFLLRTAAALHGAVLEEGDVGGAVAAVRRALGTGRGEFVHEPARVALMPFLTLAGFIPLAFVLWRRNV